MFEVTFLDFENVILIFILFYLESLCVACIRTIVSHLCGVPLICCIAYIPLGPVMSVHVFVSAVIC